MLQNDVKTDIEVVSFKVRIKFGQIYVKKVIRITNRFDKTLVVKIIIIFVINIEIKVPQRSETTLSLPYPLRALSSCFCILLNFSSKERLCLMMTAAISIATPEINIAMISIMILECLLSIWIDLDDSTMGIEISHTVSMLP